MKKRFVSTLLGIALAGVLVQPAAASASDSRVAVPASASPICYTNVLGLGYGFCLPWSLKGLTNHLSGLWPTVQLRLPEARPANRAWLSPL